MTLSVCLLTRNEESTLGRALRSVAGVADEVLVADTASTDRTAAVAAQHGARVVPCRWDDDFAAGRNFAVAEATGRWILWMNADEELAAADGLRQLLEPADAFGYLVAIRHQVDAARPDAFSETRDLRLFRRRPDLHFVGRLHPSLDDAAVAAVRREGLSIRPAGVVLRRHAYAAQRDEGKLRWTLRLLERELQDRPGQLYYQIEYGRTLLLLKDPRGHAAMAEAARQVTAARDAADPPTLKAQLLLEYLLTAPAEHLPAGLSRDDALDLGLRWFPATPPLLYAGAEYCFRKGDARRAAELLERLVQLGQTGGYDKSRAFDPGLVRDDALVNLAACYRQLGEPGKAEMCYQLLLNSPHFRAQAAAGIATLRRERAAGGTP